MSFVERQIDVTINLGKGKFGENRGSDVTLTGYRTSATVISYNNEAQGQLQLRMYGLTLDMINQLTATGWVMSELRDNRILVAAGDVGGIMSTVYEGSIIRAWGDFNNAPDVPLNIVAFGAAVQAVKPVGASSFRGTVDVAEIMAGLAKTMGFSFENHDVQIKLANPYFPGTAYDQVCACARAAGINFTVDRGVLAIWPRNGARGQDVLQISPEKNLVGYPAFSGNSIAFTTLFEPALKLGGRVNVSTSLPVAAGEWWTYSVAHMLESKTPNGAWYSQIQCVRPYDYGQ